MNIPRGQFLLLAGAVAAVMLVALSSLDALSQTARTIKVVVPFPPGGNADVLARLLAEQVGRAQGPTILIESRPGGASMIGTEAVARAVPDGHTILIATNAFVLNPHLRKLSYDPLTSFEPICYLANSPVVIAVNSASPYRTLSDLFDAARAKPGDLTLASAGPATTTHLAFEMLKRAANIDMTFVPYPGNAPAVTALLGEHVTAGFVEFGVVAEHLKAGKLRALASASRTRVAPLPDVPAIAESGYKDFEMDIWYGLFAPAKTPKETVSQLAGWFTAALGVADVRAKLVAQEFIPVGICGADFATYLRKQYDDYGHVIRETNFKAE